MPLWLASSTVRLRLNPPSPWLESHLAAGVVGQVTVGSGWASGIGAICVVMAPVLLNSHPVAIQRICTRAPTKFARLNSLSTQSAPLAGARAPTTPGPGQLIVEPVPQALPQCDQMPSGKHIVSCTPRGAGGAEPVSAGVRSQ